MRELPSWARRHRLARGVYAIYFLAFTPEGRSLAWAAPGTLWAIAKMTVLEASRRKVFTILILFAIALMSSTFFFPSVEIDYRLRLVEVWALRAAAIFTAIVGLFLAGFSLPTDFESKRIYLLVTKPVSKSFVFLGRYLGYLLLLAFFIATMGVVTVAFLRGVKLFSGEKFPPLVAYPRVESREFLYRGGEEILISETPGAKVDFGSNRALIWIWEGLGRSAFPDSVHIQSRLIFGAQNDPYRASGTVKVRITGAGGAVHETRLTMNTNEEMDFSFPASMIGEDGRLVAEMSCVDFDGIIAAAPGWLLLYQESIPFELAFARGLVLILLQSLVVLSITLMGSTFLSAPLSILLGILLYLVGSIHGYVREGSRDIDRSLAEISQSKEKKAKTPENLPVGVLKFSTTMSKGVLAAVPDFAHFDYSAWLLKDHAVSWRELAQATGKALPPILVLVFLGTFIMAFKDFDR